MELYFHAPLCLYVVHTNNFTLYVKPWSNVTFYKLVVGQVVIAFLIIHEIREFVKVFTKFRCVILF